MLTKSIRLAFFCLATVIFLAWPFGLLADDDDFLLFVPATLGGCKSGFSPRLIVVNNCGGDVYMFFTPPGSTDFVQGSQWEFWSRYGQPVTASEVTFVKTKLAKGQSRTFCIPDKGAPSGKFHFSMGCDFSSDPDFGDCIIGGKPGTDFWTVNTLFEASFGCKPGVTPCAINASDGTSLSQADWFDISAVDGMTMPISYEIVNPDGLGCNRTSVDGGMLDIASCPSESPDSLYILDSDADQKKVFTDHGKIDLINVDASGNYRSCASPCKWFSTHQLGTPSNPSPLNPGATPLNTASWYCCKNKCGGDDTDPPNCTCPECGGTQCCTGPKDGDDAYPISLTNYVRRLKAMGYRGYTWQYDDYEGLQTCASWGAVLKITLCPGTPGAIPYNHARLWKYENGQCLADETGQTGTYASLFECQKNNMKYSCQEQTIDQEKYPPGRTFKYCVVDADGTMGYDECQNLCNQ